MDSKDVYKTLWKKFGGTGYKYQLENSYVFNWESDFFCIAKSGYCYEIEVKVSRADYFADFKKEDKHIILSTTDPIVKRGYKQYNGYICGKDKQWFSYGDLGLDKRPLRQNIDIIYPTKQKPNKFIYAVPEGLIEEDELPDYAGLIYIRELYNGKKYTYDYIKRPPTLHKNKLDLTDILLEKFYWKYRNMVS